MKSAQSLYGLLLRCYPPPFQAMFRDEMLQTFRDQYADVAMATGRARLHFWLFLVSDELKNILRQQLAARRANARRQSMSWSTVALAVVLGIPLFALAYGALVTLAVTVPHPPVHGIGVLLTFAGLLGSAFGFSAAASFSLAKALTHLLSKRNRQLA